MHGERFPSSARDQAPEWVGSHRVMLKPVHSTVTPTVYMNTFPSYYTEGNIFRAMWHPFVGLYCNSFNQSAAARHRDGFLCLNYFQIEKLNTSIIKASYDVV